MARSDLSWQGILVHRLRLVPRGTNLEQRSVLPLSRAISARSTEARLSLGKCLAHLANPELPHLIGVYVRHRRNLSRIHCDIHDDGTRRGKCLRDRITQSSRLRHTESFCAAGLRIHGEVWIPKGRALGENRQSRLLHFQMHEAPTAVVEHE